MLSTGAYSKKYQFLEKERKKEERDQARKSARERAQALSKQTTQRQRALEEKKRAMAIAEEERRKRALEDRRKAQKDATEKFKMAISRLRSVSKPQQSQIPSRNDVHVEYYLPNKPKPSSRSSTSKKQRVPDGQSSSAEKVVVGRDVEITMRKGLQRRTPSLDDVLRSIRGETSSRHPPADPDSKTVSLLHPQSLNRRSASYTDLTIPIYQASAQTPAASIKTASSSSQATAENNPKGADNDTPVEAENNPRGTDNDSRHQHMLDSNSLLPTDKASENGNVVFHPVVLRTPTSGATSRHDDIRIMSPEHPDSSSSLSDSLSDSGSSTALQDSLNSALSGDTRSLANSGKRYRRKHSRERKKQEELCPGKQNTSILKSPPQPNIQELFHAYPAKSTLRSHKVSYDSDSSSSNSDTPYPAHPKSRRQARQKKDRTRAIMAEVQLLQQLAKDSTEPKIVGILKRPGNSSDTSKATTAMSTACPSEMTSAVGSVTFEYSQGAGNEGSRVPKRVRFVDQTTSSSGSMRKDSPVLAVLDMSAQTHLWNKVLPNSYTCYPPNSAFSPKMKVSLSSKAAHGSRKPPTTPPNGLVVHVPRATVVDTSPSHHPRSPLSKNESSRRSTRNHQEVVREKQGTSPHTSTSEDRLSSSPDDGSSSAKRRGNSPPEAPMKSKIPLDKTPTDDDINELWDQIRTFFRGEEKVTVPTQIYKFLPENQSPSDHSKEDQTIFSTQPQLSRRLHGSPKHASPQGNQAGQKQLVHRQQNRPLRCQKDLHQPEQLWKRHHSHNAPRLHHNVQPSAREPDVSMASAGSSRRKAAATGLSLEEQRLIQSIEKLNQRLTDHGITQDQEDMDHSHPHKRHPQHPPHIPRTHGPSDLPKTRVRRNPKAVALAAAMNAQAMDSRTALRVPTHRQAYTYYDNP